MYRPLTRSSRPFKYEGVDRLYGIGSIFVEEEPDSLSWGRLSAAEAIQFRRRIDTSEELRHAFGYILAQILAQQAGLWSEGLDVTRNLDVAAFFATHDLVDGRYVPQTKGTGVIYRFRVDVKEITRDLLQKLDFYSCPSFLPSYQIIHVLGECGSLDEAYGWLVDYRSELMLRISRDPAVARVNRPFDYIRFPRGSVSHSRIILQEAGLLLPDMILSKYWSSMEVPAPDGKALRRGQPCIEDLSARSGTTKYPFSQSAEGCAQFDIGTEQVFPADDIICQVLRLWLSRSVGSNTWLFRDFTLSARVRRDDLVS